MAGRAIMQALVKTVEDTPSIRVMEGYVVEDMMIEKGAVTGVIARTEAGRGTQVKLASRAVVIATGGIGHLYAVTTNPSEARGEGIGMAARAGAMMADMEFVQFHPTALDVNKDPAPLATEALRGHGATLINRAGERFMLKLDPDAELGPRDVVARGIYAEVMAGEVLGWIAPRPWVPHSPRSFRQSTNIVAMPASILPSTLFLLCLPRTISWAVF